MYKEYEITVNGKSNGNVILAPFKIMVHSMNYNAIDGFNKLKVASCTCNSLEKNCANDDIKSVEEFDLPVISTSKNADLVATFEALLEEKYPGNWSVSE